MFDAISHRYDLLNRLLSARVDVYWRKVAFRKISGYLPKEILDIATGTGDFAIEAAKFFPHAHIQGVDLSKGMLQMAQKKISKKSFSDRIRIQQADAEHLPFQDQSFDTITVAFGVRNFESPQKGLQEMYRVLKPKGVLLIIEFSRPNAYFLRKIFHIYFHYLLPIIGKWFSGHATAYKYLPRSVDAFPEGEEFMKLLRTVSFKNVLCQRVSLGITSIYLATK